MKELTRRHFLRGLAAVSVGATAACQPRTVVVKETVEIVKEKVVTQKQEVERIVHQTVEVEMEKIVEQTVIVKETVEKIVEKPKMVTATPAPLPIEEQMSANQVLRIPFNSGPGEGPIPGIGYAEPVGFAHMYLEFFYMTPQGELVPALAEGFEANAENTVFTFHLKEEAAWSDGKPLTAQDYVEWWNFVYHPDRASWMARMLSGVKGMLAFLAGEAEKIEGIEAPDAHTVRLTMLSPAAFMPVSMSWPGTACARVDQYDYVLEREDLETASDQWAAFHEVWLGEGAKDLIVSGPYRPIFLEPEPTGVYTFVQNEMWWGAKKPYLTRLESFTLRDAQTELLMFERGEIDVAHLQGPPAALLRRKRPEVFIDLTVYRFYAMYMWSDVEPLDDLNLRKALMHAIDWPKLNQVAWEGQQIDTHYGSFYTSSMPCFDPEHKPYPFDPAKAQAYLAKSKYGPTGDDVPRLRIRSGGSSPERIRAAQIVQEFWRVHLGIEDVEIAETESEFSDEVSEGVTNIRVSSGGVLFPIGGLYVRMLHSDWSPPGTHVPHSAAMDAKIDALMATAPTAEGYCDAVRAIVQEGDDLAFVIPTAYIRGYQQIQPWVRNWMWSQSGWVTPLDTWLAKR